ncbi:MAG: SDR family oxidoreductase [Actinobacteria bacterium]|nr:SDR family oxidoreductase [Actinomycetota bacterium]
MDDVGKGRWALVGGGSGGIGRAISKALAEAGWNVAATYRGNRDGALETVARVERAGGIARALPIDLTEAEASAATIAELAAEVPLGAAIYAAGPRIPFSYFSQMGAADLERVLSQDVMACFNLLRPAVTHLRDGEGSVIALSTQAVARYAKRDSLSSIPKSAIEGVIKAIAVEEGRYGVTANTIGVGMLEGEGMWESMKESGHYDDATLEMAARATPMRRFGSPEDIAYLARFLVSPEAAWITGQTIYVDGGYSV